jgi:hypothetical protein
MPSPRFFLIICPYFGTARPGMLDDWLVVAGRLNRSFDNGVPGHMEQQTK